MCGVCGGGVVRGPWEDAVTPRGPRELAERAAALEALCAPLRWRVRPFGAAGFTVATPTGAVRTASGVDDVTAAAVAAGLPTDTSGSAWPDGEALSAAAAVVRLSALVAAGSDGELHGPVPAGADVVHVHGVAVRVVRRDGGFSVRRGRPAAPTSTPAGAPRATS